jgi:hypothetical protein
MKYAMKRLFPILAAVLLTALPARADEGMWMINAITRALEADMQARGLKLSANEIYNADADGSSLKDAVLSLDFGCSGSIISDRGLVITNHHCAYSDVHALSTSEHNYLEDGFWAMTAKDEIPIRGKSIYFLKRGRDVTEEVEQMYADAERNGQTLGSRRMGSIIEKKYSDQTGLEASVSSMWSGSKYYLALYEVYSDIRLVAAPPVSISAFGGDIDNWEWPQHKCDFAMYRIYTDPDGKPAEYSPDNVPLRPLRKLEISLDGYREGDFAMVIGYPGRTDRYASSAKIDYLENVSYPVSNVIRGDQMSIVNSWMNADPEVRLKYADYYFSLSNVQENNEGMVQCFTRFGVAADRRAREQELRAWIGADPARSAKWGALLDRLDAKYSAISEAEANLVCYRETMVRGTRLGVIATRLKSLHSALGDPQRVKNMQSIDASQYAEMDLRVERDLFRYAARTYYTNVDSCYWGPFQKELFALYKDDMDAFLANTWDASWMTDEKRITRFLTMEGSEMEPLYGDPLYKFFSDVSVAVFNDAIAATPGEETVTDLGREYTRALYQMRLDKGVPQYPDANSTMRITYGTVGGYEPHDGVWYSWRSTPQGIIEKYDPDSYDFNLKPDWKAMLEEHLRNTAPAMEFDVNFLTDNDITGGNSGSPVLDARGRLIGLAFDGNKESLASDVSYVPGYNMCVNVDIRFVIWTLRNYAHMDRILEEIGLN